MTPRHRLGELTRENVRSRSSSAMALVPIGACEQHGPHLPLLTDAIVIEHIAMAAATSASDEVDIIVAPTIPIGYSPHHTRIGPTLTAELSTLTAQLVEVCVSLAAAGFQRIFILNGHGGNAELIAVAARAAAQKTGVRVGAGSYWVMASPQLETIDAQHHGRVPGHAGAFETSLLLSIRPELVDAPPQRPGSFTPSPPGYFGAYFVEDPGSWAGSAGFSDDPSRGSAQLGAEFLEVIIPAVAQHLIAFTRT